MMDAVNAIETYKETLLAPIYSPFIANINNDVINYLLKDLNLYTYMQNYANKISK
jgi:hypothetical protein